MTKYKTESFTPDQLGKRWQTTAETVISHIRAGRLEGFTLSPPGCKRPRYRIKPEAVAEFEERQAVKPTPKPKPRKQRTRPADYVEYF